MLLTEPKHTGKQDMSGVLYAEKVLLLEDNIAEAGIRIIKDFVFERIKAYNLVQMFGLTIELYFQNRLLDIAHSRVSRPLI